MLRRVVLYKFTVVSEVLAVAIIRAMIAKTQNKIITILTAVKTAYQTSKWSLPF
jgi:hypothetical protein